MRKQNLKILLLITFTAFVYAGAGSSGNEVLRIDVGAKPIGMGGAFTGLANNADAIYYNPAGLVQVEELELSLMHSEYIVDTHCEYVAAALPFKNMAFGLNTVFVWNSFEKLDDVKFPLGAILVYSSATTFSWALTPLPKAMPELSLGINAKYTYMSLDDFFQSAVFFDLGVLYIFEKDLSIGFVAKNFGAVLNETSDPAPMTLRLGVSYLLSLHEPEKQKTRSVGTYPRSFRAETSKGKREKGKNDGRFQGKDLIIAADVERPLAGDFLESFGVDYLVMEDLNARAGVSLKGAEMNIALGLGYTFENLKIDYSVIFSPCFGILHYPSLTVGF
ncbi:MAG: PorV/PorQ family protein [Candidatus Firestonebacteria bacterium]